MSLAVGRYLSPIGPLLLAADDDCLLAIDFRADERAVANRFGDATLLSNNVSPIVTAKLDAYFAGDVHAIDSIVVRPHGTPFQQEVWTALRHVSAGSTTSYSALAGQIGRRDAVRAVGAANGANPIPIVIPCHRVIGADGRLVGYGGGLDRKRWLLEHEGVVSGRLW
jgi:methylated-DNA-[protein]-cysteine S-methyltransferase